MSPTQTALIVISDSLVYILAISSALLLTLFLHSPNRSFSNPLYLLANGCIPAMLALRHLQSTNDPDQTCLETNFFLDIPSDSAAAVTSGERPLRTFPVVMIFHAIVTGSYWFISQQSRHQEQNVQAVIKLREDLKKGQEASKENKNDDSPENKEEKEAQEADKDESQKKKKKKKNNSKKKK
jgi:uncharacterized protein HemX